eukprot:CAMPEP_0184348330 /NCGR_PEP_ID=MMETSP1089-20130417/27572_1 /TAXON_ID=38269 ORGANISM="Gloeochaete wittrockiana, Strain SAG46.84" /NCGR_SAMPLE_ID=MMETSP1089 /ASSEMBLY_ACC=CAM_ASM_000445 /LENGTH=133 /DNA_ID=CAMNT_0026679985 /DNA_START=54 /DNA_END=455 /DNA_ORIENTATION=-
MDGLSQQELENIYALATEERERNVYNLVNGGKGKEALIESLRKPPLGSQNDDIKDRSLALVTSALASFKEDQIPTALDALNSEHFDNLIKYLYRGLRRPENSNLFLKWHGAVVRRAGQGCLIRAIAERKNLIN